jgi:2-dehydro-3-deoxygluconokinase
MTNERPLDLLTFGETMALLTAAEVGPLRMARTFHLSVAGSESNVATALARLGLRTAWCGRVGDDEFGRLILERLRAEGVDVGSAQVTPGGWTGLMIKERRTSSQVRVTYYRRHSAASTLSPDDIEQELVASARVLHLTGITPALSRSAGEAVRAAISWAREAGTVVSLDVNYRSKLWDREEVAPILRELCAGANVVFTTRDDCALVVDEEAPEAAAHAITELGAGEAIVTLGAEGAVASVGGRILREPALPVREVDPVGAGDAFAAGYLAGLLEGRPPAERLRLGAAMGAYAASVQGDVEGLPDRGELERFAAEAGTVVR